MKNSKFLFLSLLTMITMVIFACNADTKKQENAHSHSSDDKGVHGVTLFENDYAKVSKIQLNPGEEQETHDGGERLIYSLSDYSIDWEEKGQKAGTKSWKKGDVHFHAAGKHAAPQRIMGRLKPNG